MPKFDNVQSYEGDDVLYLISQSPFPSRLDGLPAGLSYSQATGEVSGSCSSAESVKVRAFRNSHKLGSFWWTIGSVPTIDDRSHDEGETVHYALDLKATDHSGLGGQVSVAATWTSVSSLPSGLSMNLANGTITGTIADGTAGSHSVDLNYDDRHGVAQSTSFTWTVNDISFTGTTLGDRTNRVGDTPNYRLPSKTDSATGSGQASVSVTWTDVTGLPSGLSADLATGVISGTLAVGSAGSHPISLTYDSVAGEGLTATFTWTVNSITYTDVTLGNRTNTESDLAHYVLPVRSDAVTSSAEVSVLVTWKSVNGLPTGLSVDLANGTISGTVTAAGPFSVTLTYESVEAGTKTCAFTWTVNAAVVPVDFTDSGIDFNGNPMGSGKHFKIHVPNYDGGGGVCYVRMGTPDTTAESALHAAGERHSDVARKHGHYLYSSNDVTMEVGGDHYRVFHGASTDYFYGEQFNFQTDSMFNFYGGQNFSATAGMIGDVHIGGQYSSCFGVAVETTLAYKIELGAGASYSAVIDCNRTLSGSIEQEANDYIEFKVDPDDDFVETVSETWVPVGAAALAGIASVVGAVGAPTGDQATAQATAGIAYASFGAAILAATIDWCRSRAGDDAVSKFRMDQTSNMMGFKYDPGQIPEKYVSQFKMDEKQFLLCCGKARISLKETGEILLKNENAMLLIKADGSITLRNGKGGMCLTGSAAVFGHEAKATFGITKSSAPMAATIGSDAANALNFTKTKVELKSAKGDLGNGAHSW